MKQAVRATNPGSGV